MKNYAVAAWNFIKSKIGGIVSYIEPIAKALSLAIEEGDIAKIKAHNDELREFADSLYKICDFNEEAIADGNLDLVEGAHALKLLNDAFDEAEDVVTGVDEDDE